MKKYVVRVVHLEGHLWDCDKVFILKAKNNMDLEKRVINFLPIKYWKQYYKGFEYCRLSKFLSLELLTGNWVSLDFIE